MPSEPSQHTLVLDLEEDIEKELHHFVKLSRVGNYAQAHLFFDKTLRQHVQLFPVAAEFADMLLEQGRYRQASEFLDECIQTLDTIWDPDVLCLVQTMKSWADIFIKGELPEAIERAENAWDLIRPERRLNPEVLPDDIHIHIFEVYVNIIVFAFQTSHYVSEDWMRCLVHQHRIESRNGFVQWFCILRDNHLLWEASRMLRALQPIMPCLAEADVEELLLEPSVRIPRSLSAPELCASLAIRLCQAQFLSTAALFSEVVGENNCAAQAFCEMSRVKLISAEQTWNMLPVDQKTNLSNLSLSLERTFHKALEGIIFAQPTDQNSSIALLNIATEADLRDDIRHQILARLYFLLLDFEADIDWRDVYSILDLQRSLSGNMMGYAYIWNMFAAVNDNHPRNRIPSHWKFDRCILLVLRRNLRRADQEYADMLEHCKPSLVSAPEMRNPFLYQYLEFNFPNLLSPGKQLSEVVTSTPDLLKSRGNERLGIQRYEQPVDKEKSGWRGLHSSFTFEMDQLFRILNQQVDEHKGHQKVSLQDRNTKMDSKKKKEHSQLSQGSLGKALDPTLDPETTETLDSLDSMASECENEGRWDEAESIGKLKVDILQAALGPEDPRSLASLTHLACVYRNLGRLIEAEEMQKDVLKTQENLLGLKNPDTLNSMNYLSSIYSAQENWKEAEPLQSRALMISEDVLGQEHATTLTSMNNLASIYWKQGCQNRPEEQGHSDTPTNDLTSTYLWKQAEKLQIQALKISRRMLGPEHRETLSAMNSLAITWEALGEWDHALALLTECVELRVKSLGPDHHDTVSASRVLVDWQRRDLEMSQQSTDEESDDNTSSKRTQDSQDKSAVSKPKKTKSTKGHTQRQHRRVRRFTLG